ncbi:MAG: radical SAM protein [Candidatus Omnitrophica bacterium]|nr:radical SAM protein [Candidatus Omnitrophota bacterium]
MSRERRFCKKLMAFATVSFFFINIFIADVSALAPATGINNPSLRCEYQITSLVSSGRLKFAESPEDIKFLLERNSAKALLLSHGKILASKDLKNQPERLYRVIIHEQIEAIMQIMAKEDREKYNSLMNIVLSRHDACEAYYNLFSVGQKPNLPDELLVNDMLAKAFELLILRMNGLIEEDKILPAESKFLKEIEPIINARKHNYFTGVFWDDTVRQAKIRVAMANSVNFIQAASQAEPLSEEAVEDLIRQLMIPRIPADMRTRAESQLLYIKQQNTVLFQRGLARLGTYALMHDLPRVRCAAIEPVDALMAKHYAYMDNQPLKSINILQIDKTIDIFPNVFNPVLTSVTSIYLDHLKVNKGERVLDVCCGSGVIAIYAALQGASHVLATDINNEAVDCTKHNAKKLLLDNIIETKQGDLFSAVPPGEKFDLICCNLPLLDGEAIGPYQMAVNDLGFKLLTRFMNAAGYYLSPKGRIVVTCSDKQGLSGSSGKDRMLRMAQRKRFGIRQISSTPRHGETYFVYEFTANEKTYQAASVTLGAEEDARLKSSIESIFAEKEGGFEYEKGLLKNHWAFLKGILYGKTMPPIYAEIDPTTDCNLDCEYCYFRAMKHENPQNLDREILLKSINELHFYGVKEIWFSGLGEPLMNPATIEAMRRAIKYEMKVGLYTNGILLDDEARQVIVNGDFIKISIDTLWEKTFEKLKKRPGKLLNEKVLPNLDALIALKKARGSSLTINVGFMLRADNYDEMETFAAEMKKRGVDVLQFKLPTGVKSGLSHEQILKAYERYKALKEKLSTRGFKIIMMETPEQFKQGMRVHGTSFQEYATAIIRADGRLYSQCYSSLDPKRSFGDIRSTGLKDIWESELHKKVLASVRPRENHYNRYDVNMDRFLSWLKAEYKKNGDLFLRWMEENYVLPLSDAAAVRKIERRRIEHKHPETFPTILVPISREKWSRTRKEPVCAYRVKYDDVSKTYAIADRKIKESAEKLPSEIIRQREERLIELFNLIKNYYPNAPPVFRWVITPEVIKELIPNNEYRISRYDSDTGEICSDPYFFELPREQQLYLVYHEIVSHMAKNITDKRNEPLAIKNTILSLYPVLHPEAGVITPSAKSPVRVMIIDAGSPRPEEICEPLGVEVLAGALKQRFTTPGDVSVDLVDMQLDMKSEDVIKKIEDSAPDLVCISIKIGTFENAEKLLDYLSKMPPDKRPVVMIGNTIATFAGAELLSPARYSDAIICQGEGENALCGVVKCILETKGNPGPKPDMNSFKLTLISNDIPNLQFNLDGFIVPTLRATANLDNYSLPDRVTLEEILKRGGAVRMESSRGCPWGNCTFCSVRKRFAVWRPIPVETIIADLTYLVERSVSHIGFTDEDFLGRDPRHARTIAEEIIKRGLNKNLTFTFATRATNIYDVDGTPLKNTEARETLRLLKEAGLRMVFVGIESGSRSQLERYHKGATVEDNRKAIETLNSLGIKCEPGFIMFDQLMNMKELRENIKFLEETGLINTTSRIMGAMRPQEGSEYKARLHRAGLLYDDSRDIDTLTYASRYKKWEPKRIQRLFSEWEAHEKLLSNHLQGLTRGTITDHERELATKYLEKFRLLDFKLVRELCENNESSNSEDIHKIVMQFVGQRAVLLKDAIGAFKFNDINGIKRALHDLFGADIEGLGISGTDASKENKESPDDTGPAADNIAGDAESMAKSAIDIVLAPALIDSLKKSSHPFEEIKKTLAAKVGLMPDRSIIYVAAPTAAGKTDVAQVISEIRGGRVTEFPVDAYLKPLTEMPKTASGEHDLDHPDGIYLEKARDGLRTLLDSWPVTLPPEYVYKWEHLRKYRGRPLTMQAGDVAVVDSIHAFHDILLSVGEKRPVLKIFLNVPSIVRLARTLNRDKVDRHIPYSVHIDRWPTVLAQEGQSILPSAKKADMILDYYTIREIEGLPRKLTAMLTEELKENPAPEKRAEIVRSWVDAISKAILADLANNNDIEKVLPADGETVPAMALQRIEISPPADDCAAEEKAFTGSLRNFEAVSWQEFSSTAADASNRLASCEKKEQSLILYADDILENAMVVDLEHTVKNILSKNSILSGGKIVLYAKEPANALILEKMIKHSNTAIEIVKMDRHQLQAEEGEIRETDAIVRFARAKGAKEILGIIRGPVLQPEELAAFAKDTHLPIVIVGPEKGVYSFAQAIAMALDAKLNNGVTNGWLIMLPPIRALTDDIKRQYEEYRNSLQALVAT